MFCALLRDDFDALDEKPQSVWKFNHWFGWS